MNCPVCNDPDSKVLDTRTSGEGIRRRRQCLACGERFTTMERIERRMPLVVKKDGSREPFDRDKVLGGLRLACRKRPVAALQIEAAVDRVEAEISARAGAELPAREIGDAVLRELRGLDHVAYVRFASVYLEVGTPSDFLALLAPLVRDGAEGEE